MKTGYVLASLAVAFSMTSAAPIEQEMVKRWSSEPQQCFTKCSPALGFGLGFGAAVSANVAAGAGVIATPLGAGAGAGVNAGVAVSAGLGFDTFHQCYTSCCNGQPTATPKPVAAPQPEPCYD